MFLARFLVISMTSGTVALVLMWSRWIGVGLGFRGCGTSSLSTGYLRTAR